MLTPDDGDQTDIDQREILDADPELKLPHGFDKGSRFDIPDGTPEFDDTHVRRLAARVDRDGGDAEDPFLDGVGQMGDDLDGLAEVVSLALHGGKRSVTRGYISSESRHTLKEWANSPLAQ